jgi:hypothetical protein
MIIFYYNNNILYYIIGALDLCYVGCGELDGVYSGVAGEGWKPWDYAAGLKILYIYMDCFYFKFICIYHI